MTQLNDFRPEGGRFWEIRCDPIHRSIEFRRPPDHAALHGDDGGRHVPSRRVPFRLEVLKEWAPPNVLRPGCGWECRGVRSRWPALAPATDQAIKFPQNCKENSTAKAVERCREACSA